MLVSLKEEVNFLKQVSFYLKFKETASSCTVTPTQVTVASVNVLLNYKKEIDAHENPKPEMPQLDLQLL